MRLFRMKVFPLIFTSLVLSSDLTFAKTINLQQALGQVGWKVTGGTLEVTRAGAAGTIEVRGGNQAKVVGFLVRYFDEDSRECFSLYYSLKREQAELDSNELLESRTFAIVPACGPATGMVFPVGPGLKIEDAKGQTESVLRPPNLEGIDTSHWHKLQPPPGLKGRESEGKPLFCALITLTSAGRVRSIEDSSVGPYGSADWYEPLVKDLWFRPMAPARSQERMIVSIQASTAASNMTEAQVEPNPCAQKLASKLVTPVLPFVYELQIYPGPDGLANLRNDANSDPHGYWQFDTPGAGWSLGQFDK